MFYDQLLFLNNSAIHIRFVRNLTIEKISNILQDKGMNPEVALNRARQVFGNESEKATLYLHNLQSYFNTTVMHKVYEYLARKALFQEQIKFHSYDHMLSMIQKVYTAALSEDELTQIRKICKANRYGVALIP